MIAVQSKKVYFFLNLQILFRNFLQTDSFFDKKIYHMVRSC